jgi:gas vesicle protein
MRAGLESMVRDVEKAIQDSANTPQGQQIRQDAGRAAESLKTASQQTVQEVRPHLVSALQQVNEELQRLINRMQPPKEQ